MAFKLKKKQKTTMKKTPKTKGKLTRRQIVNSICIVFLSTVLIVSVVGFAVLQSILNKSEIVAGIDGLTAENSSRIYDSNGELITTLSGESGVRENIKYEQIPQVVVDAFLSIEDSRFFTHNGFDLPRFLKSGVVNVAAGGIQQGGSTLTMQLVDVALFSNEADTEVKNTSTIEKIEQKVQEIFKSMDIEAELSKEKIIENYLNKINFGGPARGIQKGAQYYFGKDVEDLNLSEAAFLAGVINAPGIYNPYIGVEVDNSGVVYLNHYDEALARRNQTLQLMKYHGYISTSEYELAKSTELAFALNGATNFAVDDYDSFITYVVEEVKQKTGKNPYTTPMDIYTTMDRDAQEYADAICNDEAQTSDGRNFNITENYNERYQTGFAAVNNQTGEILALGGGRGSDETKNRAWNEIHQIGSTSKPIIDYAQAFDELGYSTKHTLEDGPTPYATSVMYNADRQFRGDVLLDEAINHSYNVPAYKTLLSLQDKIGEDGMIDYLKKLGFKERVTDHYNPGYSIGGGDFKLTPLELAGSFSTLANKGNYIEPYSVKEIKFQDKNEKKYKADQEKQRVFSEGAAWLTSYMLAGAVDEGWGNISSLKGSGYRIYGKTGTTDYDPAEAALYNYPEGIAKDKWMVGYTDTFTVATWAGYDGPKVGEANYLTPDQLYSWNLEGEITRSMLDKLTNNGDKASKTMFDQPDDVTSITHIKGLFPYATATANESDLMVSGYILKKFAGNLKTVAPDPLEAPSSVSATYKDGAINYKISAFPDPDKLKEASNTKTMSANGISASGVRFFDKSFLFGAVEYKVDISVNDSLVTTQTPKDGNGNYSSWSTPLKNNDKVKVCGYYKYAKTDTSSDKRCQTITISGVTDEKTYTIDSGFDALFTGGLSYHAASNKVNNYMNTYYPEVKYSIRGSSSVSTGELDLTRSTIYSGAEVNDKDSYLIYIGN